MEDSNILDAIVAPKLEDFDAVQRSKFRVYQGVPIFRFSKKTTLNKKGNNIQTLKFDDNKNKGVKITCNFENPFDKEAHLILQFFEQNLIDFEIV